MTIHVQLRPLSLKAGRRSAILDRLQAMLHAHDLSVHKIGEGICASGPEEEIFQALKGAFVSASVMQAATFEIKVTRSSPPVQDRDDLLCYRAIGHVENDFDQPTKPDTIRSSQSRLVLDPCLSQGLEGIEPGQKVLVLFDFHLSEGYALLQHPRGDQQRPKRGVFALRSPNRPNSIGVTEVEVLSKEGSALVVRGLDALHRSPILDIKPA